MSDVYYGLNLQMILYLFILWKNGKEKYNDVFPAGVLYMPAGDVDLGLSRDASLDDTKRQSISQYKMNGFVLEDPQVVSAMEEKVKGIFIPVEQNKDGSLSKRSSLLKLEELGKMERYVNHLILKMAEELHCGEISASPVYSNGGKSPCEYCDYSSVCGQKATASKRPPADDLTKEQFFNEIEGKRMSVRSWTQGQRQAINASGGGILVSAAAGSGKTAVLVERVIRLITREDNPVPADRLLIVTFTKAAAAEMKQRISAALAEKIADNPINLHYKEQQILLSRAHICTIHAFCSELLRDHFEQLSIAPDFRIADEAEIGLLKQAAVDRVLEESYEEGNDNFIMLSEFFSSRTDRLLSEQMLLIYEFIRSHPFPLHWLDEQENIYRNAVKTGELPWMNVVIDEALEALDYGKTLIASALKMMDGDTAMADCYRSAFESDRQFLSELAGLLREGRWDEAISGAENYAFPKLKGLRNYDDAPKKKLFRSFVKRQKMFWSL